MAKNNKIPYKVSYFNEWDEDGTHYNQRITISIPHRTFLDINDRIITYYLQNPHTIYYKPKPLQIGKNFTNLSTFHFFKENFLDINDKRIKDRNTIILIKTF